LNQAALNLAGGAAQTLGLSNRWTPSRISREEVQIELEQRGMTRDTIGGEGNRQNPTITKFQVSEMARDLIRKSRFGTSWGPPNSWDEKYHDYLFGKSGSSVGDWLSTARTAMSHGSPMRSEDTDAAMRQIVQQLGLENPNVAAMKAISGMDIKGFNDAVQSMKSSVLRMRGGPTLVPANEDR
jgi:hypothetical protein